MENTILASLTTPQLIVIIVMCSFVLIGFIAFRINERVQMRVALLMDNECKIFNRNGFAKYIKRRWKRFKHPNLINVKIVNLGYLYTNYKDKYQMMIQITDTMLKGLTKVETIGRVEFNEFMILVDNLTKDQLREKCKDISDRLSELYFENYGLYNFKLEFGVYEDPDLREYQTSIDRGLAVIDYSEIRQNNVWYFSQDVADKIQKLQNVNELKTQALESHQFAAYVQPKVDYKTGKVCGGEVLVRWVDEDHRVIFYPDDFIPLFEQNGFIKKLDFVMFDQTCAFAQTLKQKGYEDVILSVNISKINFDSPTFIDDITEIIKKYPGINPTNIEIEITESANMEGSQHLSSIIMSLRQLGYKLAMDDFGKDYSTLGSLVNCPYDTIKMDMFFFRNRLSTEKEKDIATNVLNLLSRLNVEIVCEGIEDENTINTLGEVTHDFVIQGYYISKPIPISQFEPFLNTHYEFKYPEIKGTTPKASEEIGTKEETPEIEAKDEVKQIAAPSNEELTELKRQLEDMKNLISENAKKAEEERKKKEIDDLKAQIQALQNSPEKDNSKSDEYQELQRQINDLKYNNRPQAAQQQDSNAASKDQIELMIERLKSANKEQFDKLKEENARNNKDLKAQLAQAQKEREEFKKLLAEKETQQAAQLSKAEQAKEQEEANKKLNLDYEDTDEDDDDTDEEEEDEVKETKSDKDYKPSLSKSEINDIIKKYQDKYQDNWVDEAQNEMGEEAFHNLANDIKYYNEHEKKSVRDKLLAASDDQKKLYNIVKNEFMKYFGVSFKLTNAYDKIYVGKKCVAQIGTTPRKIKVYLAVNPADYSNNQFPHKDVGNKKAHAKNPFYMKVHSNLSIKRLKRLISEMMIDEGQSENNDYKSFDYANSLKYEQQ